MSYLPKKIYRDEWKESTYHLQPETPACVLDTCAPLWTCHEAGWTRELLAAPFQTAPALRKKVGEHKVKTTRVLDDHSRLSSIDPWWKNYGSKMSLNTSPFTRLYHTVRPDGLRPDCISKMSDTNLCCSVLLEFSHTLYTNNKFLEKLICSRYQQPESNTAQIRLGCFLVNM